MVIFKVFLRFTDKADQHISNSHKPRIRNKIPFISSMLTIVMMPGCLPQLRALRKHTRNGWHDYGFQTLQTYTTIQEGGGAEVEQGEGWCARSM